MNPIENNQIEQIVSTLWSTVFNLDAASVSYPLDPQQPLIYGSYVTISGGFSGGVIVQTSYQHARLLTATVFEKKLNQVAANEMSDVMQEVSNIIGGQIKAILPGECYLSLPSVQDNLDGELLIPGTEVLQSIHIKSEGESIHVRLAQRI